MSSVPEEIVVWEYIRWDGKYREWFDQPVLNAPDFKNSAENQFRWDLLAGNHGLPGDPGQVKRIRYCFDPSLPPYRWAKEVAGREAFANAFSNYCTEDRRALALDEIAAQFSRTKNLPPPFNRDNTLVVHENLRRLKGNGNIDDFNAILFCRPTPYLPQESYRIVEGTKRAIAYCAAQLEGIELPEIRCYFGDYYR